MKRNLFVLFIAFITVISSAFALCNPIDVQYENGIYHITIDGKRMAKKIQFVAAENLMTNKEMHMRSGSALTINTGFFDPKNKKTISYIVTDRTVSEDPLFNQNLLENPILRQNLSKIINRTEFRVVECDDKYHFEIVPHKTPVDFECSVVTSAQGGPQILPTLQLEEEFFIVKNAQGKIVRESASVLEKTARTVIGLKGEDVHILIITNDNPKDVYEVQDLCKTLGLDRAMMFDGGSSTSLNYKNSIDVTSTKDSGGRLLKSFMILQN